MVLREGVGAHVMHAWGSLNRLSGPLGTEGMGILDDDTEVLDGLAGPLAHGGGSPGPVYTKLVIIIILVIIIVSSLVE